MQHQPLRHLLKHSLVPWQPPCVGFCQTLPALLGLDAICPYMLQPWYRGIRDWRTWWRLARLGKIPDQESSVKTCWSPILHHDLWLLLEPSDHRDRNYQHPQMLADYHLLLAFLSLYLLCPNISIYMIHVISLHGLFCDSVFNLDYPPLSLPHLLHQCLLLWIVIHQLFLNLWDLTLQISESWNNKLDASPYISPIKY